MSPTRLALVLLLSGSVLNAPGPLHEGLWASAAVTPPVTSRGGCGPPPGAPILWVDGQDPLGTGSPPADGAALATVTNKGSLGGTFTGAATAQPLFESECIGFPKKSCMRFDGTNDVLVSSLSAASWKLLHHLDYSCLVLFRQTTFSPEATYGLYATATTATSQVGNLTAFDDAGSAEVRIRTEQKNGGSVTNNRILDQNGFTAQIWNRLIVTYDADLTTDAMKSYVNGVAKDASGAQLATPSTSNPSNTLHIGGLVSANFLSGDIAQIACYATTLSDAERAAVDTWSQCIETATPHGPMPGVTLASSATVCDSQDAPCRIGVMGDSITSVTSPASWVNGFLRTTYPTIAFQNEAVGGTTIEIARTNQWTNILKPAGMHAVMMLIGTNDVSADTTAANILADIDEVAADALASGLKVITVSILPRGNDASATGPRLDTLDAVNAGLITRANGLTRIHSVVFTDMEEPTATRDLATAFDSGDGLHPNQTGHDALGGFVDVDVVFE